MQGNRISGKDWHPRINDFGIFISTPLNGIGRGGVRILEIAIDGNPYCLARLHKWNWVPDPAPPPPLTVGGDVSSTCPYCLGRLDKWNRRDVSSTCLKLHVRSGIGWLCSSTASSFSWRRWSWQKAKARPRNELLVRDETLNDLKRHNPAGGFLFGDLWVHSHIPQSNG